jgi:hypothetical protein
VAYSPHRSEREWYAFQFLHFDSTLIFYFSLCLIFVSIARFRGCSQICFCCFAGENPFKSIHVSVVDNKLSLVGIQVGWAVANTVGYVVCIMRGVIFIGPLIQHNFEPIAGVEDEWQMNDDLVADVSTDEILAEHDSANITILLLLLCTIMMNNAKSKRESKRKS